MLIAPLIDCALEKATRRELVPFFMLTFGWSFLANFKEAIPLLPTTSGLGASTGLSLLGVYVVARICRKKEILEKLTISTPLLVVGVIGLFLFGLTKYNLYNSPITVLLTIGVFALSLRIKWSAPSVFGFLAPSMFSVYLLHTNMLIFGYIPRWSVQLEYLGSFRFLLLALCFFVGAAAIDVARRFVFGPFIKRICAIIDSTGF